MTTSLLVKYHIPEAIQIRVTKVGDFEPPPVSSPVLDSSILENPSALIEVGEDVVNAPSPNLNHRLSVTFCVDPQLTSLAILQSLIVRAFNLHCDFFLYFDEDGGFTSSGKVSSSEHLQPLASDADLQAAFAAYHCSLLRPFLSILLHIIDYSTMATNPNPNTSLNSSKTKKSSTSITKTTTSSYRTLLSDWDVVTSSDVILAQTISATNTFLAKQIELIKERAFTTTSNINNNSNSSSSSYWYLAESIYQYIITTAAGGGEAERRPDPLDDAAFRAFQDAEGRIGGRARRDLRIAVYRRGVEPSLRRAIWKHLLNVYPEGVTGQERLDFLRLRCQTYRQMRDLWQNQVADDPEVTALLHMVRKDVYRTDRHHPFYANKGAGKGGIVEDREEDNPNVTSLLNILITYALNHRTRYCQGMSDLASPLLYVMKDESHAYVAFCALMSRLAENFSVDGLAMGRKFEHLNALLAHYDPDFHRYLVATGAQELLFAYRWLLLDLKREFPFEEMLEVLEVIWASIPPASGAHYRNLFDEGCLYTPGRQRRAEEAASLAAAKAQSEQKAREEEVKKKVEQSKQMKPVNQRQLRSIKFLPNALSSEDPSQVLDSPTSEEEGGNGKVPWEISPDLSTKRRQAYVFEHPTLGSSKCGPSFEHSQQKENSYNIFGTFEVEDEEIETKDGKPRTDSTSKNSQIGIEDNVSSCSTFDSGIQRSNTLSSVVQGSDESVQSSTSHTKETCNQRRQRFQCLSGLRNAHCNGDDEDDFGGQLSEDDGLEMYHDDDNSMTDENDDDDQFQRRRVFDLSDEFSTFKTGSVNSTRTLLPRDHYNKATQSKPKSPLFQSGPLLAKSLLVGHSFSIDSLNNGCGGGSFDKPSELVNEGQHRNIKSPLINVDEPITSFDKNEDDSSSIHSSPVNEFEATAGGGGKMAKSVSEEMINNLVSSSEKEMATLNIVGTSNGDDLDNLSSSSTSSLVILSKKTPNTSQKSTEENPESLEESTTEHQRLLSPEELGPNDAFMLFLCLTMLLQSREHIMASRMDRNDIQMYFDGLIRKHSVKNVLGDARHLFHTYLSIWHKECLHK